MTKSFRRAVITAGALFLSHAACGAELAGKWRLVVENPQHVVVATLSVQFTDEEAKSCLGGDWKKVHVVTATTHEKDFFPISDPLSYTIENGQLTIGRNEICDNYVSLRGPLNETSVSGDYVSFGLGEGSRLGYFELRRVR